MSTETLGRILTRMKELGMNPRSASLAAGMGATAIRDLVRRPGNEPTLETVKKLAVALQTTPEWLAYGAGPGDELPANKAEAASTAHPDRRPTYSGSAIQIAAPKIITAIYGGKVEAGSFREVDELDHETAKPPRPEPQDPDYPDCPLIYFDVVGDSMNALRPRALQEGDQVVGLDFEGLRNRVSIRDGMIVVVEQTASGGHLRERSVKQIENYQDRTEFCPRSTNPKHKPIVVPFQMDPDDGKEVKILAIVRRVTADMPGW